METEYRSDLDIDNEIYVVINVYIIQLFDCENKFVGKKVSNGLRF